MIIINETHYGLLKKKKKFIAQRIFMELTF